MPHRTYTHACCPEAPWRQPGKPNCPHCGTAGTPAGLLGSIVVRPYGVDR